MGAVRGQDAELDGEKYEGKRTKFGKFLLLQLSRKDDPTSCQNKNVHVIVLEMK